jgi:hypothetical protein
MSNYSLYLFNYQFLKDQAALAADEITADSVRSFVFESDKMDRDPSSEGVNEIINDELSDWNSLGTGFGIPKDVNSHLGNHNFRDLSCSIPEGNRTFPPRINGNSNKKAGEMSLYPTEGSNLRTAFLSISKGVKASIESWQAGKVASWQGSEGKPILWFSVLCLDRRSKFLSTLV